MAISVGALRPAALRRAAVARRRPPIGLVLLGLAIAVLSISPLVYLVVRALEVRSDALAFIIRPRTVEVVGGTVALAGLVGAGTIALGVPLAWLTTRSDLPGRRGWAVLTAVPLAIPSFVTAFAFVAAFGPRGAVQSLLEPLGVERLPEIYGLPGAALVLTLASYPYVLLATRGALLRSDPRLEEAARLLGDSRRRILARVTLPLLLPAIGAGVLLAVLYTLSDFGAVSLLQFDSLSRAIHVQYRASFDRSLAAILALMLVGLSLAVGLAEARLRRRVGLRTGRAASRPGAPVPLGAWRWPAVAFCAAVVGLALAVPVATIAFWLARGVAQGEALLEFGPGLVETAGVALGAAVLAIGLALPVAVLGARHPGAIGRVVDRAVGIGYALPGIVVAFAVVSLATGVIPFAYQTLGLLVLAYAIRFLPLASGPIRATMTGLGPRVEEAGRTLGDGPIRAFVRLTVPLLRPALVAGGALVFLTVAKELPMALLLGPIGFETLATGIWDAASSGFYARAAAPAAVLLVLSAGTITLLLRGEDGR
jgi:iron(III) transport system permease protein